MSGLALGYIGWKTCEKGGYLFFYVNLLYFLQTKINVDDEVLRFTVKKRYHCQKRSKYQNDFMKSNSPSDLVSLNMAIYFLAKF